MKCSVLLLFEVECGGLEREKKTKTSTLLRWGGQWTFIFFSTTSLSLSVCLSLVGIENPIRIRLVLVDYSIALSACCLFV